jgi:hypothetical protein
VDEFVVNGGSTAAGTGFPPPEQAKTEPMPGDYGLRLHEHQSPVPIWPQPPESEPKQTISLANLGLANLAPKHRELMPKRQIFE